MSRPPSNLAPRVYSVLPQYGTQYNRSTEVYEELKRVVIFAGVFFFITIVCIMSKLQVGADDILRWSPIVWLVGVCIAGAMMNALFYCGRKIRERKRRRQPIHLLHDELLYHLPIPRSYPCLAPPPHAGCCGSSHGGSIVSLPSYESAVLRKVQDDPPNYTDAVAMLDNEEPTDARDPERQSV